MVPWCWGEIARMAELSIGGSSRVVSIDVFGVLESAYGGTAVHMTDVKYDAAGADEYASVEHGVALV